MSTRNRPENALRTPRKGPLVTTGHTPTAEGTAARREKTAPGPRPRGRVDALQRSENRDDTYSTSRKPRTGHSAGVISPQPLGQ